MATDRATTGETANGVADTTWTGIWSGAFGARTDLSLIVTDNNASEILLLGHPVVVTQARFTETECVVSGPDITLTLQRVDATSAQGSYVNAAGRKATALFRRV